MKRVLLVLAPFLLVGCLQPWPAYGDGPAMREARVLLIDVHFSMLPAEAGHGLAGAGQHCETLWQEDGRWRLSLPPKARMPPAVVLARWDPQEVGQAHVGAFGYSNAWTLDAGQVLWVPGFLAGAPGLLHVAFDGKQFLVEGQAEGGRLEGTFHYAMTDAQGGGHTVTERMAIVPQGTVPVGVTAQGLCL